MSYSVVVTDYYYPTLAEERKVFAGTGIDIADCNGKCVDEANVIECTRDADAVITQFVPITRRVIESLRKCKVIVRYAIGLDSIDVQAATERRIMVANVPDYCISEVSDHALALILALVRKIGLMDREVQIGNWSYKRAVPIARLSDMTLGLIAFGSIARCVAQKASVFGFKKIYVHDPYFRDAQQYPACEFVSLETLLGASDIVSIHAPATPETRSLINRQTLGLMKTGAFLVNTSRGALVNEADLLEALRLGKLSGVGLDVLENENEVLHHPLHRFDNVIMTPHMAWYSTGSIVELQRKAAEQVRQALLTGAPSNWANRF